MKVITLTLALMLLLLTSSYLETAMAASDFCQGKCMERCYKGPKPKRRCYKDCVDCCMACKCVPSLKDESKCPCYMTKIIVNGPLKKYKCP